MEFDVFLCHNSQDKAIVHQLYTELKNRGLSAWIDSKELRPGQPWQDALEKIVTTCKAAIVCIGTFELGPWQQPEMRALLSRFARDNRAGHNVPIIPVYLPGSNRLQGLPVFLQEFQSVDLTKGLTQEGIDMLCWGITGTKPSASTSPTQSRVSTAESVSLGTPQSIGTVNSLLDTTFEVKPDPLEEEEQVVLLLHGIRDHAAWQKMVIEQIATENIEVIGLKFPLAKRFDCEASSVD